MQENSQQGQMVHLSKNIPFCVMRLAIYQSRKSWLSSVLRAVVHEMSCWYQASLNLFGRLWHNPIDTPQCVALLWASHGPNHFVKFLWQDVSNLFSAVQHFPLNWTSSLSPHSEVFWGLVYCNHHPSKSSLSKLLGTNACWTSSHGGLGPWPIKRLSQQPITALVKSRSRRQVLTPCGCCF